MRGKVILLGVTGSIAAYKAADLTRLLVQEGANVRVVMTPNATRFITPLTMQILSGNPVCIDLFDTTTESEVGHISLAKSIHLAIVAPATANIIAKMAGGIADDYLTTVLLATTAPVLVCPAMNSKMYQHPATQRNINTLRELGYRVLEPSSGSLACGDKGPGRLPELPLIVEMAKRLLTPPTLAGKKVLVSAGPTREPFDPVRFISNPSSGKMGYAVAVEAARRSAEVHLVTGPSSIPPPYRINCYPVTTAQEMNETIHRLAKDMDIIVMAAAVGDYRPRQIASQKLKKSNRNITIDLEPTPDILASLGRIKSTSQILVGFAAETENLIANAMKKLECKNLDLIIANDLTLPDSGFCSDTNRVKIIDRGGNVEMLPCMSKEEVARHIWDRIEGIKDKQ